jgi:hypothetical protein
VGRSDVCDLAREVAKFRSDPLGFVQYCACHQAIKRRAACLGGKGTVTIVRRKGLPHGAIQEYNSSVSRVTGFRKARDEEEAR